jgi:hypothetical protein
VREWLVIEKSWKNSVFADDDAKIPMGYIPRNVVERELGIRIEGEGRCTWFSREDGARMRAHPEWRTTEPPGRAPFNPWQFEITI